jgi:hypothetical protein
MPAHSWTGLALPRSHYRAGEGPFFCEVFTQQSSASDTQHWLLAESVGAGAGRHDF